MSLSIENLSFSYGRVSALEGIDVRAGTGRLTAVLGPNASGKSTLLRCAIGSLKPRSGSVMIDGSPAHTLKARHLAGRLAYVPQRSTVSAAFTVREVIELGRYSLPYQSRRISETIKELDLEEIAERKYSALSVGQQQRVMLARAFAQLESDGILILDEPTSAMDLKHQREVMAHLRRMAASGVTILLVVHDITLAATVADDIWLLESGKLIASGSQADVMTVERLQEVFQVAFERLRTKDGRDLLVPVAAESINLLE